MIVARRILARGFILLAAKWSPYPHASAAADSSIYKVGELPAAIYSPDTSAVTVVV